MHFARAARLSDLLHRREQQADQDRDDRDHHEQFDQAERGAVERMHERNPNVKRWRNHPAVGRSSSRSAPGAMPAALCGHGLFAVENARPKLRAWHLELRFSLKIRERITFSNGPND